MGVICELSCSATACSICRASSHGHASRRSRRQQPSHPPLCSYGHARNAGGSIRRRTSRASTLASAARPMHPTTTLGYPPPASHAVHRPPMLFPSLRTHHARTHSLYHPLTRFMYMPVRWSWSMVVNCLRAVGVQIVPHSCGEHCHKPLRCEHSCKLLCHPGPCPPCPQVRPLACPPLTLNTP